MTTAYYDLAHNNRSTSQRLEQLRVLLKQHHVDYYLLAHSDPHQCEYVSDCWQRLRWISGFSGSAGQALIGPTQAYLWTDSRYFLQAEKELDPHCFQLMRQGLPDVPSTEQWLKKHAKNAVVGLDPQLITLNQAQRLIDALASCEAKLLPITQNLIDVIWTDRPPMPQNPIHVHALAYAGTSCAEKLAQLRDCMKKHQAQHLVLNVLDEIAWLFNIRGHDISCNPLVISYAIITLDKAMLFVEKNKITQDVKAHLANNHITVYPYTDFAQYSQKLPGPTWLDSQRATLSMHHSLKNSKDFISKPSPITKLKATKNATEQQGMYKAHQLDAIAVIKFLNWLEHNWQSEINEHQAAQRLMEFRKEHPDCVDLSFPAISAFAENGAIVHYHADSHRSKRIDDQNLYLIDSGGQYYYGTTDITRTIHLGHPTPTQQYHYTLVLKGHLALRHCVFKAGSCGENLDILARQYLWKAGFDYGHGTGHGVGYYLSVHEGPQRISPNYSGVALQAGMIVSNEPGIYFPGDYGIRIENLCIVVKASTRDKNLPSSNSPDSQTPLDSSLFYSFDDLTLVPYARNLIDTQCLSSEEIDWINTYHQHIYQTLAPSLKKDCRKWLQDATQPLGTSKSP